MNRTRDIARAGLAAAALALAMSPAARAAPEIPVFAGVEPVRWLVQQIGGERVSAHVLVPPGRNPHTFEPTPRQLSELEAAKLYFAAGMPFEAAWVVRLSSSLEDLEVVRLVEHQEDHDHGTGGDDPHAWTDPLAAVAMAGAIRDALVRIDPGAAGAYRDNFDRLERLLGRAHDDMAATLEPHRGRVFVVYHPAWGALAQRYGLRQLAVETQGKSPGARHLAGLISDARAGGACAVFLQPQLNSRAARQVAEALGVPVVRIDPLAGDLAEHLPAVARTLARYLESPCPR